MKKTIEHSIFLTCDEVKEAIFADLQLQDIPEDAEFNFTLTGGSELVSLYICWVEEEKK